ncbi:hypothetical protein [Anaeromassilibacillus sp. An250]|uniref:hypothetical protein n=1 Tax=Anaeromassilibacillus sp. An250 TaxID=1965604 RepID=UPI00155F3F6C|nr:hypothetical protein [Anaeromassilibacillus sp. An250]
MNNNKNSPGSPFEVPINIAFHPQALFFHYTRFLGRWGKRFQKKGPDIPKVFRKTVTANYAIMKPSIFNRDHLISRKATAFFLQMLENYSHIFG